MDASGVKKMLDSAGVGKTSESAPKGKRKGNKAKDPKEEPAKAYSFILGVSFKACNSSATSTHSFSGMLLRVTHANCLYTKGSQK